MHFDSFPSPLRILFVEDSSHDALFFFRTLERSDLAVEITHFVRAEDALPSLDEFPVPYDLVVADHKLPGMSGLDFCKCILDMEIYLPTIIVTGAGTEYVAIEAMKTGVNDYLVKDQRQSYLDILPLFLPEVVKKYRSRFAADIYAKQRKIIAAISEMFLFSENMDLLYVKLPRELSSGFNFPVAVVTLLDERQEKLVVKGISGVLEVGYLKRWLSLGPSCWGDSCVNGEQIVANGSIKTCLSVPVRGKNKKVIGTLALFDTVSRQDASIHIPALQVVANHLGQEIERKKTERKLRGSEERLRLALAANSDGVWGRNLITNEVFVDENWCHILGYKIEDLNSKLLSWDSFLHPEDKHKLLNDLQSHIFERSSSFESEFRMRSSTGNWQYFLSRGRVIDWDESGKPLRVVGTYVDITNSKKCGLDLHIVMTERESDSEKAYDI